MLAPQPPHAIVLRIRVAPNANVSLLADALGEFARTLEADEAGRAVIEAYTEIGLVPDRDDPGRYWWEIVTESHP